MIRSGISQIGGKFRLRKDLLRFTPVHEYFVSLFCGSCIYELNKPRPYHYECFNDANSQYINYLEVLSFYREEFDAYRKKKKFRNGILGLVSRRIYNDIKDGFLKPKDRIERAVMFQYLVKLGFASTVQFRGMVPETTSKKKNVEKAKADFQYKIDSNFKGTNIGKSTRPYTNNDMGILTPLDPKATTRLQYVILEELDFLRLYLQFFKAYHTKKGFTRECFIYADPPYPATEEYYGDLFPDVRHLDLIELMLGTPFNFMLSIGKKCELYVEIFRQAGWVVEEVKVKYSTDANTQKEDTEYLIMNYRISFDEDGKEVIYNGNGKFCNYNPDIPVFPLMKKDEQKFNQRQTRIDNYFKI